VEKREGLGFKPWDYRERKRESLCDCNGKLPRNCISKLLMRYENKIEEDPMNPLGLSILRFRNRV